MPWLCYLYRLRSSVDKFAISFQLGSKVISCSWYSFIRFFYGFVKCLFYVINFVTITCIINDKLYSNGVSKHTLLGKVNSCFINDSNFITLYEISEQMMCHISNVHSHVCCRFNVINIIYVVILCGVAALIVHAIVPPVLVLLLFVKNCL